MDDIEAMKLLIKCKELGITMDDVAKFKTNIKANEVPELDAKDIINPISVFDEITDEEVLYWATPHFDELQMIKEMHSKQLKEQV